MLLDLCALEWMFVYCRFKLVTLGVWCLLLHCGLLLLVYLVLIFGLAW